MGRVIDPWRRLNCLQARGGDLRAKPEELVRDRRDTRTQTIRSLTAALMLSDESADQWCAAPARR